MSGKTPRLNLRDDRSAALMSLHGDVSPLLAVARSGKKGAHNGLSSTQPPGPEEGPLPRNPTFDFCAGNHRRCPIAVLALSTRGHSGSPAHTACLGL
jgi:hypothetical protein